MVAVSHVNQRPASVSRGRARRLALAAATILVPFLGTSAFLFSSATKAAPAVASALVEVSNSCLTITEPTPSPVSITFWGSLVAPNTNLLVIDQRGYLGAGFAVTSDGSGTFEATATFTPNPDLPLDDFFRVQLGGFIYAGGRQIRFATSGTPPCPSTKPSTKPCSPPSAAVQLSADGILSPLSGSLEGSSTEWFLDYPGAGRTPSSFATSIVTNGNITASLPAGAAAGNHLITAHVELRPGAFLRDDAWVSWRISVCQPATTTTPTNSTTTTTTTVPTNGHEQLTITPSAGPTGSVPSVQGTGFTPGATVVLQWRPGIGSTTAVADAFGSFTVPLLVMPHDVIGPRQVVAFAYPPNVSADFLAGLGGAGPPNPDPVAMLFRQ
jgi:hypothetical protein